MMMTTIPKSSGWQVYVDGRKQVTVTVGKFLSVFPGIWCKHQVTFKFKTPFFKNGAIVTLLVSLVILGFKWSEARKGITHCFKTSKALTHAYLRGNVNL